MVDRKKMRDDDDDREDRDDRRQDHRPDRNQDWRQDHRDWNHHHPNLWRGKLPARENAIQMKFSKYLHMSRIPAVPASFGHVRQDVGWGMLGNDRCGDCVIAGAAHESMLWSIATGRVYPRFSDQTILKAYSDCIVAGGGKPYDPEDPSTDTGLDMQQAAKWRQETGVDDANGSAHLINAYAEVQDPNHVLLAAYLFGACGFGMNLPQSAEEQFMAGHPWDDVTGQGVGGHYVPVVGRNSQGLWMVITWGKLHAMTQAYAEKWWDDSVAYISTEYLKTTGLSPELLDMATLTDDLKQYVGDDSDAVARMDVFGGSRRSSTVVTKPLKDQQETDEELEDDTSNEAGAGGPDTGEPQPASSEDAPLPIGEPFGGEQQQTDEELEGDEHEEGDEEGEHHHGRRRRRKRKSDDE